MCCSVTHITLRLYQANQFIIVSDLIYLYIYYKEQYLFLHLNLRIALISSINL